MEISNLILEDREKKNHIIKQYIKDYQVITLKANIPGTNKQTKEAYILLNYFDKLLNEKILNVNMILDGADGPMYIYLTSKDQSLKDQMIKLEESILGRFVDIDVFNGPVSENRRNLRKCYICDLPAAVCGRLQKHSKEELNEYIYTIIKSHLSKIIRNTCDESIMEELNMHPKFGLVTPYTSGSHSDMTYETMIAAKNAILDSFVEMFNFSYDCDDIDTIFKRSRLIGLNAEKKMNEATYNVNAYKGLIFVLGLFVSSIGYKVSHLNQNVDIFEVIKDMTKDITKELLDGNDTFGKIAYQKYGITGARGEAEAGFPHVKHVIENYNLINELDKYKVLFYLILNIDDTVLLKRAGSYEEYLSIRKLFECDLSSYELVNELDNFLKTKKVSFGGAADLLIVCLFLKKLNCIINIL